MMNPDRSHFQTPDWDDLLTDIDALIDNVALTHIDPLTGIDHFSTDIKHLRARHLRHLR